MLGLFGVNLLTRRTEKKKTPEVNGNAHGNINGIANGDVDGPALREDVDEQPARQAKKDKEPKLADAIVLRFNHPRDRERTISSNNSI